MVQPVSSSTPVAAGSAATNARAESGSAFLKALRLLSSNIVQHLTQKDKVTLRAVNRETRNTVESTPVVPKRLAWPVTALRDPARLKQCARNVAQSPGDWPFHLELDCLTEPLNLPPGLVRQGVELVTLNVRSSEHLQANIENVLRAMPNLKAIVVEDAGIREARRATDDEANRMMVRRFCPHPSLLGKLQTLDLGHIQLNRPGETLQHLVRHAPQLSSLSLRTRGVPPGVPTTYMPLTAQDVSQFATQAAQHCRIKNFTLAIGGRDGTSQAFVDALGPVLDGLESLSLQSLRSAVPGENGLSSTPVDEHQQTLKLLGAYAPNLKRFELSVARMGGGESDQLTPDLIKAFLRAHPKLETLRFNAYGASALVLSDSDRRLICDGLRRGTSSEVVESDDIYGLTFKVRPNAAQTQGA